MKSRYAVEPRHVDKPWGWELVWAETDDYVGKLLFVRAGQALSLQYHEVKDESWLVREGRATLELGEVGGELETIEITAGDTLILEVSTPHLDDVVRLEDLYGREGTSAP